MFLDSVWKPKNLEKTNADALRTYYQKPDLRIEPITRTFPIFFNHYPISKNFTFWNFKQNVHNRISLNTQNISSKCDVMKLI